MLAGLCAKGAWGRLGDEDASAAPGLARIHVHPREKIGDISPLVFGAGVEWIDDGNGIFDATQGAVRPEVVEALKPLRIPVIRFPGGILADHYQWRDGVGPREQRPRRRNPMDEKEHANNFGTDEFIELCRALGSDALITANAGTGALQDALQWQSYFTRRGFPLKFWEIGNEIYLAEPRRPAAIPGNDERIYKAPAQYADLFVQWSEALRASNPAVSVGAIAGTYNTSGVNRDWLRVLLERAGTEVDFLALHNSFAPMIFAPYDLGDPDKRDKAYRAMFAASRRTARDTRMVKARLQNVRGAARIAITEHFPLFGAFSHEQLLAGLDQSRTLASALFTASVFHALIRENVWMANYNLITSRWFGALLTSTSEGWVRTPTYWLWDLYRNRFGATQVQIDADGPAFDSAGVGTVEPQHRVPYLDAVASTDGRGSVFLAVINRNLTQPVLGTVDIDGVDANAPPQVTVLGGPAANAINGPALTRTTLPGPLDQVRLRDVERQISNAPHSFQPHSVTVLRWNFR